MPRCISPVILDRKDELDRPSISRQYSDSKALAFRYRVVPCGICVNCLKNKQSDFSFRIVREARKYGSLVFVTFTYGPGKLPFSVATEFIDKSTGEQSLQCKGVILEDCPFLKKLRSEYDNFPKSNRPKYFRYRIYEDDEKIVQNVFTPSLNRRDFRLWLKRERVQYKRKYGKGLPAFSYCCIGEYGPNTVRPHMHCCFMGLSYIEVCRMCESWTREFGYCLVEKVNCINLDGTSGFVRAARYVSKYLYKGKFDNPAAIAGYAEKGRTCCSISLGTELSSSEKDYLLCKDVFGPLDFQNVSKLNGNKLTDNELFNFAHLFAQRSVMCVDGTYFKLPRAVIRRLFYDTIKTYSLEGKVSKIEYKASPFRAACSNIVQDNFLRDYFSKFESSYREFLERRDFTSYRSAKAFAASCVSSQEKIREADFLRNLSSKSKF